MKREVADLLLEWEERYERGETIPADVLCADCPESEPELRRRIKLLQSYDLLLTADDEPAAGSIQVDEPIPVPVSIGNYEIRGVLGRGGMGVVYSGWDPMLDRQVAIKVLGPATAHLGRQHQKQLENRIAQEARALAKLQHAHIVPVHAGIMHEEQPCFVMGYMAGGSLAEQRERLSNGDPQVVVSHLAKVAQAVGYAHQLGMLHRDLKPANILLDEQGEPHVCDFGLAKLFTSSEPEARDTVLEYPVALANSSALTMPGHEPGTPAYMAPEQFDPKLGPVSPATDVWALGVILYELLSGQKPFDAPTRKELADTVTEVTPAPLSSHAPKLNRRLNAIVERCLQKDPKARYPNGHALAEALQGLSRRRWPTALHLTIAAAVVLLGLLWMRQPEQITDTKRAPAYREFVRSTDSLLDRLLKERSIELIPKGKDAKPLSFAHSPSIRTAVVEDGLKVFATSRDTFLELLPAVPLEKYRITAKIRLHFSNAQDTRWGIYINCDQAKTTSGTHRYFEGLIVGEKQTLAESRVTNRETWSYQVIFAPLLISEFNEGHDPPSASHSYILPNVPNTITRELRVNANSQGWRKVVLDVAPTTATARCEDEERSIELMPLEEDRHQEFVALLRKQNADVASMPRFPGKASALGIYLREAAIIIESFRIEAMDN